MRTVLISAVVGMGVLIIVGIIALVYGLIQKADNPDFKYFDLTGDSAILETTLSTEQPTSPPLSGVTAPTPISTPSSLSAFGDMRLTLPAGYRVVDASLENNRLLVRLQNAADATRLMILNSQTGTTIGTIDFAPAP